MWSKPSCLREIINHSSALELPAQHKTFPQSCASGSIPNTNKHIYIYIINNWLMSNIENTSSCSYAVRYSTQYKNKNIKIIIIINRHMPISVRSKIRDITFGNNGAGNGLFITNFSSIQSILVFLSFYGLIGRGFSNP